MGSTTVEILSTSKGPSFIYIRKGSTTVEILSTSKGITFCFLGLLIYNSRNSQYFQRTRTGKQPSTYLQQQKFLVLPKETLVSPHIRIYNSRNSQYFQRIRLVFEQMGDLQQQKFLVLPKALSVYVSNTIYNSRNSQYFQRCLSVNLHYQSTTVEILSTSKGCVVSVLPIDLQQQKFLVLPKVMALTIGRWIYNSRNSQYFQRSRSASRAQYNLQQQKFLVLPKGIGKNSETRLIYNSRNSQYFQRLERAGL